MGSRRYRRSLRPGQVESDVLEDIRDEIQHYLELRAAELVDEGMDPAAARRAAEARFGDAARIEADLKSQAKQRRMRRGTTMTMGGLKQDLGYALRTFRRNPGFTAVAVLTLALAVGGNTAIFSVVDAALLRALPFANDEQLVFVNGYHLSNGEVAIRYASYPEFRDWRERSQSISPMASVDDLTLALAGEGGAEPVRTEVVSEGYFDILGVAPLFGRAFSPEEHAAADATGVALLSYGLWQRRFGADPGVVGSVVVMNDRSFTVLGVMPEGFGGTALNADVWLPESASTVLGFGDILDDRGSRFLGVVGRLTTDHAQAQTELDAIARELQAEHPALNENRFAQVQGFREAYLNGTVGILWILMGAGVVLLLIAAANVANLLLVRSHARTREIVLRRAMGAESQRIARQLLTESVVLAALGSVVGLVLAYGGLRVLGPMIPQGALPGYVEVRLSGTTFLYSLGGLALAAMVMGVVPAVATSRLDIATTLREGGRAAAGGLRRFSAQHGFVVTQTSLALVLMVGAGLLTRSFRAQLGVDTGVSMDGIVAMRMSLPGVRYPDADARRGFAAEMERLVSEIPGVESASLSSDLPFRGGSSATYVYRADQPQEGIRFYRHHVTPSYFETLGIEMAAGRPLADSDVDGAAGVGVITETMARRVFPGGNAVGQTLYLGSGRRDGFEVVGVVGDVRYRDLTTSLMAERNSPDILFAYDQIPSGTIEVAARVQGDPEAYLTPLREAASQIDPQLPVFQLQPLSTAYRQQTATPRFAAFLMALLSGLAVVLACVGIYGVLAFAVGQRAREIAIRRAIGASSSGVAGRVVMDALTLTAVGLVIGGGAAFASSRLLATFLFGVGPTDPVTFVTVAGALVSVAVLAALIPAGRAARRQPAEALSAE